MTTPSPPLDLIIIGGGVNGTAIARDAVGRGLSVLLIEKGDLASETSSKSTKLFHGGLRYLEYFEFKLVRDSLREREVLLQNMPHICWPLRFILPIDKNMRFATDTPAGRLLRVLKGHRPAWIIRAGLALYDTLGARKILPPTRTLNLPNTPEGAPLKPALSRAFEYSDCWVDDARLVVLMAVDIVARGGRVMTRTAVTGAARKNNLWQVKTDRQTYEARALINATGGHASRILPDIGTVSNSKIRLVKGSHIITKRLYPHDKCYFFQGDDGRIIFAIPYQRDFTLIGTTEVAVDDLSPPVCSEAEMDYLCERASRYFAKPLTRKDIISHYAGLRALYNEGDNFGAGDATAATRDYVLELDTGGVKGGGAPVISVFGGKITTHRRLAESVLARLSPYLKMNTAWTATAPLKGGDFALTDRAGLVKKLHTDYPFLDADWAERLFSAYGLSAWDMLGTARGQGDLGVDFGATLYAKEVDYLTAHEFAQTAEDIIWRRSKLGLRLSVAQIKTLDKYIKIKKTP